MLPQLISATTFLALLGCGLMAGVFFAYSNSVMPGLARTPHPHGMATMNHINLAIQNPLFFAVFLGTAVLSAFLVLAAVLGWTDRPAWVLAGAVLYLSGSIFVTFRINVPMNDALAAAGSRHPGDATPWPAYLRRWTLYNHVRTAACTAALAAFAMAMK